MAKKKQKDSYVIIEKLRETNAILDMRVTDDYNKAKQFVQERFDEETISARITQQSAELLPSTVKDETPIWFDENTILFSDCGNKISLQIIPCKTL